MKHTVTKIVAAAALAGALSACSDEQLLVEGEGRVKISATLSSDVNVISRAQSDDELAESCTVWISNDKGVVREYHGLNTIPTDGIALYSGHYKAEGWAGTKAWASWEDRWYEGETDFDIRKGETTPVDLKCKIQNTLVSVVYEAEAKEVLHDYSMTVSHVYGELVYDGDDERKGYFLISDDDRTITYTLSGTTNTGEAFTRTKTIENAKPTTEYVLTVRHTGENTELGGGYLTIEVDEREVVVEDEILITVAPQFVGYNFDMANGLSAAPGELERHSVFVKGACALRSVIMKSPALEQFTGIGGDDVDLMTMTDAVGQQLANDGIHHTYTYDADNDVSLMKITFEEDFTHRLTEGDYLFTFTATDALGKTSTTTMKVTISPATVTTKEVKDAEVYATSATLRGIKLKEAESYGFNYRSATGRSGEWSYVEGHVEGNEIVAEITGILPGTTYEYVAVADDFVSTNVMRFTTETAAQLPNASFEEFQGTSPILFYSGDESNMFWDSGNHGSAKMSKNVTQPSTDYAHDGQYSLKLESQFVGLGIIGAFAAGNVFVGKFLGTEDTTYGILGWGREFTSRPKALKVWVKYTPQAATYSKCDYIKKGEMDQGIIYMGLLDGSTTSYGSYSGWPVVVATKVPVLFDPKGSNVIAYGEKVFTEATPGDGMVEVTIPLDYLKTDVKPSNIILTCSASRYGDYYTGGPSVMYIDDFELVY